MKLYLNIIKALLNRGNYERYFNEVSFEFLEKNHPELYRLVQTLPLVHGGGAVDHTLDDLEVAFFGAYPKADIGLYNHLFIQLRSCDASDFVIHEALEAMRRRELGLRIARAALAVAEGASDGSDLPALFEAIHTQEEPPEDEFVSKDIARIIREHYQEPGLRWRLPSLNATLGSLRKGNFGFLFARPESGKTTFLASEVTFMAAQLREDDGPIIWFNNEQQGGEVALYAVRAALALTKDELGGIMDKVNGDYIAVTNGKLEIKDDASISKKDIERICAQHKPSLIIFDQIDKIKGFAADRNDLELAAIYQWARELAKKYCPVIAVCQAGGSGDGKKWLTMNDVDNSKTGKQAEADWILGIGKTNELGEEMLRFLYLSKNKLPGDKDTDSSRRHDRWAVLIKPEVARYADLHQG